MQVDADQLREFAAEFVSQRVAAQDQLLPLLHHISNRYGGVPDEAAAVAAEVLNLSVADVVGVISFYVDFHSDHGAQGVDVCCAEACQSMGADTLYDALASQTGAVLRRVYCLGNCAAAPSVRVGDRVIGRADVGRVAEEIAKP